METEQQQQQQPMMPQQYSESPDLDTVVETSIGDHSALVVEAALPLVEHVESTFMVEVALVESACQDTVAAPSIPSRIVTAIQCLGFDCNENSFDLNLCISNPCVPELKCTTVPLKYLPIHRLFWIVKQVLGNRVTTQFYHFRVKPMIRCNPWSSCLTSLNTKESLTMLWVCSDQPKHVSDSFVFSTADH